MLANRSTSLGQLSFRKWIPNNGKSPSSTGYTAVELQSKPISISDSDAEKSSDGSSGSENRNECVRRIRHIVSVLAQYQKLRTISERIELLKTCYEGSISWKPARLTPELNGNSPSKTAGKISSYGSVGEISIRKPIHLTVRLDESVAQKYIKLSEENDKSLENTPEKKPFLCLFCFKDFISNEGLRKHSLTHTAEKPPFMCAHCSASFHERYSCLRHMRIHSNERSYFCHTCRLTFESSHHLSVHEQEHSLMKRYRCRYCHKKFRSKFISERHELIYHTGLSHACRVCSRKFASSLALMMHQRKHGVVKARARHEKCVTSKKIESSCTNRDETLMSRICNGSDVSPVDLQKYDKVKKNANDRNHSGSKKRPSSCNPCEIYDADPPVREVGEIRSRRRATAVRRRYSEPAGTIQHVCRFC